MRRDVLCVLALGDDVLVVWGGREYEFDMSKYDHCREWASQVFTWDLAELLTPRFSEVRHLAMWEARAKRAAIKRSRARDWKLRLKVGAEFATGSGWTCPLNTLSTFGVVWYWAVHGTALPTGIVMKGGEVPMNSGTFLRGWWVPAIRGGLTWLPLPSQVLKMGKLCRQPTAIAHTRDWRLAYRVCAYALGSSLGEVPEEYPILGPFLARLRHLGLHHIVLEDVIDEHKPVVDRARAIERPAALAMMCLRYGVSVTDIEDAERLIRGAEIPSWISHPVFEALQRVDYH
jgi:hypothetical protein